ncbi:GlcG/HbpS family heme-binding protein [Rhizobium sp. No.120]
MALLELGVARTMIAAAETRAGELGVKATITILDQGGDLVAVTRMDGAWAGGFDLALGKAHTARAFQAPSSTFVPMIQPGEPLFGVNSVAGGRYVIVGGGLPVRSGQNFMGAVGISGGTIDQDVAIAEAAVVAFKHVTNRKIS